MVFLLVFGVIILIEVAIGLYASEVFEMYYWYWWLSYLIELIPVLIKVMSPMIVMMANVCYGLLLVNTRQREILLGFRLSVVDIFWPIIIVSILFSTLILMINFSISPKVREYARNFRENVKFDLLHHSLGQSTSSTIYHDGRQYSFLVEEKQEDSFRQILFFTKKQEQISIMFADEIISDFNRKNDNLTLTLTNLLQYVKLNQMLKSSFIMETKYDVNMTKFWQYLPKTTIEGSNVLQIFDLLDKRKKTTLTNKEEYELKVKLFDIVYWSFFPIPITIICLLFIFKIPYSRNEISLKDCTIMFIIVSSIMGVYLSATKIVLNSYNNDWFLIWIIVNSILIILPLMILLFYKRKSIAKN